MSHSVEVARGKDDMANRDADLLKEFARTLSERRAGRGWSQEDLGQMLAEKALVELGRRDVNPPPRQTISRWERARCFPDALNGYLLCRVFAENPEDLCLHTVVTPRIVARYDSRRDHTAQMLALMDVAKGPAHAPPELDWQRLDFVLRAMRHVDLATVEDQWLLTRRYLEDVRRMRGRTLLELLVAHVVRLRQLRIQARDQGFYRELTIMLGETLVAAGRLWTGQTDFGLAVEAYRSAATLGDELGEEWLRTTGLMSQAQLSGIHAIAPWTPAARTALMEATQGGAMGASPQIRVWYHATRAQIYALLGQQAPAQRALEFAARASAMVPPGGGFYFPMVDPVYLPIQEASVTLLAGRPREATELFRRVVLMVEPDVANIRTWATVYLAHAQAAAGDAENAYGTLDELSREALSPLLAHSAASIVIAEPWTTNQTPSRGLRHQLDTNM